MRFDTLTGDWCATPAAQGGPLASLPDERLQFETFLAELSAAFVSQPADQVETQIESALRRIVEFLDVDRGGFLHYPEDQRQAPITHSYEAPGIPPLPRANLDDLLPWYAGKIRQGQVLRFSRLPEELPAEAVRERAFCTAQGLKANLTIPVKIDGAMLAALGFGCFRRHRDWPDELVQRLRLVGEIFANALARKRSDLALREREERFRLLADTAPVLVWMAGPDTLCTYFNKPWLAFTGRPLHRELGHGWSEGVHPDDLRRCLDTYVRAFAARQSFRMEFRLRRFDGKHCWVLDTGVPRFESDGAFLGYIGSCIDISEQKRLEEEAQHLREQLARVARITTMGELAATIAHEINQPLCAIVSNAQAAQRLLEGAAANLSEVREILRDIVADSRRASEVVARLRGLFQKHDPERDPVDLNDAIRAVLVLLEGQLMRNLVTVSLDLAADLPPVLGDRVQLQQVVLNLVLNAIEAMGQVEPEQRVLSVCSAHDREGAFTVSVHDPGPGIAAGQVEQVFDAFFTTKPGGLGIGLAISRSIIEAHGGRIWVEATAGRGATFRFALPASSPDALPQGGGEDPVKV